MPWYDGTGPRGLGPGTGWGLGPCGAGRRFGFGRGGWGRRFGRGFWGWGMGRGGWTSRWFGPGWFGPPGFRGPGFYNPSPTDEVEALREEEAYLRSELEAIQKRLAELEASSKG